MSRLLFIMFQAVGLGLIFSSIGGCGDGTDDYKDPTKPLDPPDGGLEPPDGGRSNFQQCFSPRESFQIKVEGGDLGGSALAVDRETICVEDEPCRVRSEFLKAGSVAGHLRFTGKARWVSFPDGFWMGDPGDPGYGLMAQRTQRRATGEAIARFGYGDDYPAVANQLGLAGAVEGTINLTDCSVEMTIKGTVFDPISGDYTDSVGDIALAFYAGNECLAEDDFGNEAVRVHLGPLQANFTADQVESGEPVPICTSGCSYLPSATVPDQANPDPLTLRLIRRAFVPGGVGDGGVMDSGRDSGPGDAGDAGTPDGGI